MSALVRYAAAIYHLGPRQAARNLLHRSTRGRGASHATAAGRVPRVGGQPHTSFLPHAGGARLDGGALHGNRTKRRGRRSAGLERRLFAAMALQPPLLRLAGRTRWRRAPTARARLDRAPPAESRQSRLAAIPAELAPAALGDAARSPPGGGPRRSARACSPRSRRRPSASPIRWSTTCAETTCSRARSRSSFSPRASAGLPSGAGGGAPTRCSTPSSARSSCSTAATSSARRCTTHGSRTGCST